MAARTKARKRAVDVLFEADQRGVPAVTVLADRLAQSDPPVNDYTVVLVEGVVAERERLDELISTYSQGWTLERMPAVDRSVLRLGAWEVLYNDDVPDPVAVSEAVEPGPQPVDRRVARLRERSARPHPRAQADAHLAGSVGRVLTSGRTRRSRWTGRASAARPDRGGPVRNRGRQGSRPGRRHRDLGPRLPPRGPVPGSARRVRAVGRRVGPGGLDRAARDAAVGGLARGGARHRMSASPRRGAAGAGRGRATAGRAAGGRHPGRRAPVRVPGRDHGARAPWPPSQRTGRRPGGTARHGAARGPRRGPGAAGSLARGWCNGRGLLRHRRRERAAARPQPHLGERRRPVRRRAGLPAASAAAGVLRPADDARG
nr:transcription antitermination factor NusB [Angustibacter aerolatus]